MKSTLALHIATDQQDWKLRGQYNNYMSGIVIQDGIGMPAMWTPPFNRTVPAATMSTVTLNRIELYGGVRVVKESFALNNAMFTLVNVSATFSRWYADTLQKFGSWQRGIYDMELTDSFGRSWFTNPFKIETACSNPITPSNLIVNFYTNSPATS